VSVLGQSISGGSPWRPSEGAVASGEAEDGGGSVGGSVGLYLGTEMNYGGPGTRWCDQ
jgi:hypothetical protein